MRLSLLLFLLVISSVWCGGESKPSNSHEPAGKVTQLVGAAEASSDARGIRPLALGDQVFADDTLRTSKDSELEIFLHHNRATWILRGAKSVLLRDSAAWRAKGTSAGLLDGKQSDSTSAAGRHGEKQAGEDPSTVMAAASEPEQAGASMEDTEGTQPARGSQRAGANHSDSGNKKSDNDNGETQSVDPQSSVGTLGNVVGGGTKGEGSGVGLGIRGTAVGKGFGNGTRETLKRAKAKSLFTVDAVLGALDKSILERLMRRLGPTFSTCSGEPKSVGIYQLAFTLDKQGKLIASSLKVKGPKAGRACVRAALLRLRAPGASAPTRFEGRLTLSKP